MAHDMQANTAARKLPCTQLVSGHLFLLLAHYIAANLKPQTLIPNPKPKKPNTLSSNSALKNDNAISEVQKSSLHGSCLKSTQNVELG